MPRKHPDRLLPDSETKDQWRDAAADLDKATDRDVNPETYVKRWMKFWREVLEELQEQETWQDRDVRLLGEYVEHMRLADFHGRLANARPYKTSSETGRTYAHPGFKLRQEALVQARVVAKALLLGEIADDEDPGGEAPDKEEL